MNSSQHQCMNQASAAEPQAQQHLLNSSLGDTVGIPLVHLGDESPKTCSVFLSKGGMELFLNVLELFLGESAVETKVLGLVNNIAEVPSLRSDLMKDNLMCILRNLLHSTQIDVSYFAAGIVAHLASDGP
ncbi:hypothetical protein MTO96_029083 [Rhipicephalus appendiculatus]